MSLSTMKLNKMSWKFITINLILMISALNSNRLTAFEGDLVRVKNLSGTWKFSIGEREEWISAEYDDTDWESIQVPSPWENQGFYGYNGFGFYRKTFTISNEYRENGLYLILGYIDDVDETYLNGQKIGSTGTFPPIYATAYNAKRVYRIPKELINYNGLNILAVKVYDSYQAGGIVGGDIGIYVNPFEIPVDLSLEGEWKFKLGDELGRKSVTYNDSQWDKILVPAKWEDKGYRDYDGYAWYRKSFYYKGTFSDETIVLVLGKIDDVDEVYVNGVKVGMTGDFVDRENQKLPTGEHYQALRGYYFSTKLLKSNQKNTIAVRVYDSGGDGGIYEGPVGLVSQTRYIEYWRKRKQLKGW